MRCPTYPLLFVALCLCAASVTAQQTPAEQLAEASALFDARKYAEAATRLDLFLASHPKHPKAGAAALVLGRSRAELKQYDRAIAAYEKAIASKDPEVVPTAQVLLGEAAMQTKQWNRAVEALGAAVKAELKPAQAVMAFYWLGEAHFQLQNYPQAEQAYLRVLNDFRRSDVADRALFGAALSALRQGKEDLARQRFQALIERYPESEDRLQAQLLLAQLQLKAKQLPAARAGFEAVLRHRSVSSIPGAVRAAEDGLIQTLQELKDEPALCALLETVIPKLPANDPQKFRAHLTLAHSRYRQKQYAQALSAYEDASRSAEESVAAEAMYWQGNTLAALDRPGEAAQAYARFVMRHPKHPRAPTALLRQAEALVRAQRTEEAVPVYQILITRYPQSPEADRARQEVSTLTDRITDPDRLLAAVKATTGPERARGLVRVARLYLAERQIARALPLLEEALRANPAPEVAAEAHYLQGLTYETQDKPAQAVAALTQALQLHPGAEWAREARVRLPALYLELGQPASAEKAALAALETRPDTKAAHQVQLALIQAYTDQKKWDLALDASQKLLEGNPPPGVAAAALLARAWAFARQGKTGEAQEHWKRLVREYPQSEHAPEALLRIGDTLMQAEKYAEAQEHYSRVVLRYPDAPQQPEARYKLGSALYNQEKYAEAAAEYEAVIGLKNADNYLPESLYWAGLAREKSGEKEAAVRHLTRLIREFPRHSRVANARVRLAALNAIKDSRNN
ncbi:MAG: tetratricopeptide repeat protein [Chloroherpetonaceae bacterium]|nr:tetratricopeptide repeat protein [Chthonomonadaceae bacterium]MDW8208141.1 tetratricopeptide repeat protein [Chloroherpetonaceae bacterium]